MEPVDCIVCGEHILIMNNALDTIRDGAVAIKDGIIIDLGRAESIGKLYCAPKVLEGEGRAVLPGFINTHTHAAMVFFRGLADDLPLNQWLEQYIWPAENAWLSPHFVSDAIELACLEMTKAGVTTYNDMYFFGDSAAEATKKMGMRAVLGAGILDFPSVGARTISDYFEKAERFISAWKGDDLITPCIAPHAAYTCGPDTLKQAKTISAKWEVPLHIHLSETEWEVGEILKRSGKRPVKYLDDIGFLDQRVVAAHCVWVDGSEIEKLAQRKVSVSHCVESNLKLASGIAPVTEMLKAGVKVTFGTDGAASNNDLNILGEMATAAKLHKAVAKDPTAIQARTALLMGTRWGAEALGLGAEVGSIEKGKAADITVISLTKPHLSPLYDVYSHIVYSARPSDVESVLVNGKLIIEKGSHTGADEEEIMQKARKWGRQIALGR